MVDIFSFWDYPGNMILLVVVTMMLGSFGFFLLLGSSVYWYCPTNFSSLINSIVMKFEKNVFEKDVRCIMGTSSLVVSLLFFTFIYVFGIFSPWCYPLGVHTVMITSVSLSLWIMGVMCNMLGEDLMYAGHFCLPSESLGLSGVMSDIELISKFLQWITVSLRLSLNMIVGTFMIMGVFSLVSVSENLLIFMFFKKMSIVSFLKLGVFWVFGFMAFFYEMGIMSLQVFLYMFLWQFYLKDSATYCLVPSMSKMESM